MTKLQWLSLPAALAASVALAQKPAEPKTNPPGGGKDVEIFEKVRKQSLEELLTTALLHSPEVQVAEAKVKESEAHLRQIRLQVAQRLVDLHTSTETQHRNLALAEEEFRRMSQMRQAGTVSQGAFAETESKLQNLKGQIAQLDATVATLTGRLPALNRVAANSPDLFRVIGPVGGGGGGGAGFGGGGGGGDDGVVKPRWPRQAMVEKLHKALEQPIAKVNKFDGILLNDVVEYVREQSKDVAILAKLDGFGDQQVVINFKGELTLGSFLEVLMDTIPDLKVFVRDYGLLITMSSSAPDDGLSVVEFRQKRVPIAQ